MLIAVVVGGVAWANVEVLQGAHEDGATPRISVVQPGVGTTKSTTASVTSRRPAKRPSTVTKDAPARTTTVPAAPVATTTPTAPQPGVDDHGGDRDRDVDDDSGGGHSGSGGDGDGDADDD